MELTISKLLYGEIIWNKEKVVIALHDKNDEIKRSEMKRLEFQYDAIDNDYEVYFIEPMYDKETDTPYLLIHCE